MCFSLMGACVCCRVEDFANAVLFEDHARSDDRQLHEITLFLFSGMQENKSGAEKRKDAVSALPE